jgi:hypothetical protein
MFQPLKNFKERTFNYFFCVTLYTKRLVQDYIDYIANAAPQL